MAEITWLRGHDPEMEVHSCDGKPPSARIELGLQPSARIALSPFSTQDLHFLLQCQGLQPAADSQAPRADSKADACAKLPEISSWWDWRLQWAAILVCVILLFTVPVVILCRISKGSGPLLRHRRLGPKAKLDDEATSSAPCDGSV